MWPVSSGVLGFDGNIYFVPRNLLEIGKLDLSTRVFSRIPMGSCDGCSGDGASNSGVQAPNRNIYFAPANALNIGVFNPRTEGFSIIKISSTPVAKYHGRVLAQNGLIYFILGTGSSLQQVLVLNPATSDILTIDPSAEMPVLKSGGVLGLNGHIHMVACDAVAVYKIEVEDNRAYVVEEGVCNKWKPLLSPFTNTK